MKTRLTTLLHTFGLGLAACAADAPARWSPEQATAWGRQHGWLVGCNFTPSTAINQLEMWQADSFDPTTLDRELGWAEQLGFNSVRVFLHHLPWQQDAVGFTRRMERFLTLADKHRIGVMFVLFDSCWDPNPQPGQQRAPRPHLHNSGWVQCPGREFMARPERLDELKPFVQGVVRQFRNDRRVQVWDLFNEPDNLNDSSYGSQEPPNKREAALALLQRAFVWAREMKPTQPLTSGVWVGNWPDPAKLSPTERVQLDESDVISFHSYGPLEEVKRCVQNLRRYQRPILCTEYMARPAGSSFDPILGFFKQEGVGAYNWGFVAGKTQTIYPWDSWKQTYTAEPPRWFHDIFRADGTPYDAKEVEYIRALTRPKTAPARR